MDRKRSLGFGQFIRHPETCAFERRELEKEKEEAQ